MASRSDSALEGASTDHSIDGSSPSTSTPAASPPSAKRLSHEPSPRLRRCAFRFRKQATQQTNNNALIVSAPTSGPPAGSAPAGRPSTSGELPMDSKPTSFPQSGSTGTLFAAAGNNDGGNGGNDDVDGGDGDDDGTIPDDGGDGTPRGGTAIVNGGGSVPDTDGDEA